MQVRVASVAVILVLAVAAVAPAQDYLPRRGRVHSIVEPQTAVMPVDSTMQLVPRNIRPRGLDAPVDPKTYVIGPGDKFVVFLRPQGKQFPLEVLPEGRVLVPNAGLVQAAGLTIEEFRDELKQALSSYYRGSEVYCQLVLPRTFVAYVLGDVEKPGPVQMLAPFRVDEAVREAGGTLDRGSRRQIEIREGNRVVRTVDLVRFERMGDASSNPPLHEGQIIFVPAKGPTCALTGEVWREGTYEILPGETAADILALGGGYTTNADSTDLVLERLSDEGQVSVHRLTDPSKLIMEDRDVVVIPDVRSFPGADFVRVQGGGGRDGRIYLAEGETLDSFRPRFVRLRNDYDLANSRIERKKEDGSIEFIPVDLTRLVVGDTTLSMPLKPGDVINIPRLDDIVFVTGEVVSPGKVDFQRGLPVGRYIAMANGPTERGSIDKVEIYDSRGNSREGNRDSVVYRGETILVKRRTGVILGNLFIGFVSLTSLFLSVYAVISN